MSFLYYYYYLFPAAFKIKSGREVAAKEKRGPVGCAAGGSQFRSAAEVVAKMSQRFEACEVALTIG